jgi:hypothetical protein
MPNTLYNRVRVSTATTGTGTVTLGAAVDASYFTFAEAGVPNAATVSYVIEDGTNIEFGTGTYTSSGTTLSRDTVTASKISGTAGTSKINLSGAAVVFISALAADITVPPASSTDNAIPRFDGTTGRLIQNSSHATLSDNGELDIIKDWASNVVYMSVTNTSTVGASYAGLYVTADTTTFQFLVDSAGAVYAAGSDGVFNLGTAGNFDFYTNTNGVNRMVVKGTGEVGIGLNVAPDRLFHVESETATTNAVTYVQRLTSLSSGTPATGIGVGIEFEVETAAGNNEIGATIEAVTTDVGSNNEDFDVSVKTMKAGAAASEGMRVAADWSYFQDSQGTKNYVPHSKYLSAQHSVSSTTATEVTALSHALVAGTYVFDYYLICQAAATATGLTFAINYTGTATRVVAWLTWPDTGVTAALGAVDDAANATTGQVVAYAVARTEATSTPNLSTGTTGVATQNVNLICKISGVLVVSDDGELELWHGSETANATSLEVGSSLILHRTN